ncbi:MAG TPA: hypothetical protein VFX02_02995 [Gammaproteobacteria bacterium]|nr:hypothetical protein [Gammaproteobacteria bacterium]
MKIMRKDKSHGANRADIAILGMTCQLKTTGAGKNSRIARITVSNRESRRIKVNASRTSCIDSPRVACNNASFIKLPDG